MDEDKQKNDTTSGAEGEVTIWSVLAGIVILALLIFIIFKVLGFLWGVISSDTDSTQNQAVTEQVQNETDDNVDSTQNQVVAEIVHEPMDILITSQTIKQVDGKYRYFFNIKNNDDEPFTGDINIDLISAEGKSIYDRDFQNASIGAGIGKNVYIDISTGPVRVHGANGIANFEFTASIDGQAVNKGNGSIAVE